MRDRGPRRRRIGWKTVVALAALVGGAALVATVWGGDRTVGPIALGNWSAAAAVGEVEYVDVDPVDLDAHKSHAVDAGKPGAFVIRFDIVNRGRVPLTFESPPSKDGFAVTSELQISDVAVARDWEAGSDVELEDVTMQPGERRRLTVTYRWKALCGPRDDGEFLEPAGAELRYGWGGVGEREQVLEPPNPIVLVCGALPRPGTEW